MKPLFRLPPKKDSFALKLLREVADSLWDQDRVVLPWAYRFGPMTEALEAELTAERRARRIREAMRQLERQEFIKIREIGNRMEICLTDKGSAVSLIERMRNRRSRGGGRLLLVSFDIPEQERSRRNLFTRQLRYAGFRKMHASLWSTTKDVTDDLLKLLRLMRAGKWIAVYDASPLSTE